MALRILFDHNELLVLEGIGYFVFFLASLLFVNYNKFMFLAALVTLFVICCLYVYNILRSGSINGLETDCNKLEAASEGTEERSKNKEIENEFEVEALVEREKMMKDPKNELTEFDLVEKLRLSEEIILIISETSKEKCATLEEEKRTLAQDLEKERKKVLGLEEQIVLLEQGRSFLISGNRDVCDGFRKQNEKLYNELEGEKLRVSELVEKCMRLEEENDSLASELYEERFRVSELDDKYTRLDEEKFYLECELGGKRIIASELDEMCKRLAVEKDNLEFELDGESFMVSELEDECTSLEEEKDNLQFELEKETEQKRSCEQLLIELMKTLGENNEKLNKLSELEEKCKKLELDNKVGEVEREKLLALLDTQTSLVGEYKDMLNKEECLMKLFSVKTGSVECNEAATDEESLAEETNC